MKIPNHIAIIMDGNGRWGLKKFNSRTLGHKYGVENIRSIIIFCIKKKIKNLTLYALSKDNLKRSKQEILNLFNLFQSYFDKNKKFFELNRISILIIGEKKKLPKDMQSLVKNINNKKIYKPNLNINVAFNYSAKDEIIGSIKKILKSKKKISIKNIEKNLYTLRSGDPELLIRTGNTFRLSDFLLWQVSYTEIFFIKKLWPDFTTKDLNFVLRKFQKVRRNFGSNE